MPDLFASVEGHGRPRPRSLADILEIEALVRVPTASLLHAMGEIRAGVCDEYDGLSLVTRGPQLTLRTPVDPALKHKAMTVRVPCAGRFQHRLAVLVRDFIELSDAQFYDRSIDLILCANEPALSVAKYGLAVHIADQTVRARKPSVDELELLGRIAALDAENRLAPPRNAEELAIRYERDRTLTKLLKGLRGDACQICGWSFVTAAGESYTECHHLEQLAHGGLDVSRNMVVLCPNHHRQFHYGRVDVISHSADLLVVSIDSELVSCPLAPQDFGSSRVF